MWERGINVGLPYKKNVYACLPRTKIIVFMVFVAAHRSTSTYFALSARSLCNTNNQQSTLPRGKRRVNWRFSFGNTDLNMKTGAILRRRRRRRRRRWQRCCLCRRRRSGRFLSMLKMRSAAASAASVVVEEEEGALKRPIRFAYM